MTSTTTIFRDLPNGAFFRFRVGGFVFRKVTHNRCETSATMGRYAVKATKKVLPAGPSHAAKPKPPVFVLEIFEPRTYLKPKRYTTLASAKRAAARHVKRSSLQWIHETFEPKSACWSATAGRIGFVIDRV